MNSTVNPSHNFVNGGQNWRVLTEINLSGSTGDDVNAVQKVGGLLQNLPLDETHLQRMKVAVGEASLRAMSRNEDANTSYPFCVRILTSWKSSLKIQENEITTGSPQKGWGFFLVERLGGMDREGILSPRRVVELYLYNEEENNQPS